MLFILPFQVVLFLLGSWFMYVMVGSCLSIVHK